MTLPMDIDDNGWRRRVLADRAHDLGADTELDALKRDNELLRFQNSAANAYVKDLENIISMTNAKHKRDVELLRQQNEALAVEAENWRNASELAHKELEMMAKRRDKILDDLVAIVRERDQLRSQCLRLR